MVLKATFIKLEACDPEIQRGIAGMRDTPEADCVTRGGISP